jgi:hypothetical protein
VRIVINDVETALGALEARRLCEQLRSTGRGGVRPSAEALVLAVAISRGLRDTPTSRLVIRERGAIEALRAALASRSTRLSDAEAQLLEATRGQSIAD